MTENENVVQPEPETEQPAKKGNAGAAVKEWFRKFVVKLKRQTHMIPLVVLLISTVVELCTLNLLSDVVSSLRAEVDWIGLLVFISTLVSILVLVTYLNAFPKRKKPNIVFLVMTFVEMAIIIVMDILYYIKIDPKNIAGVPPAQGAALAHVILVGISAVLLATLPLYKKLLMKINTRKVLESTDFSGEIDTSAEV